MRPARPEDRPFVLATSERLAVFGPPPWRTPAEVVEGEARTLRAFFDAPPANAALLVAEDEAHRPLGFAYVEVLRDYFRQDEHGHVGILAVAAEAEGKGAGGALLAAAEDWSRARGFDRLTLNVFEKNARARAVYAHRGFRPESLRYVKPLE
ncbi:MAG TPA: GNAT family N-acetyltransferase [Thermoanaerobaculia bacterium]|nr:GNAT family N-acetyltransferase [Thermoanaerobaculia bacterium]